MNSEYEDEPVAPKEGSDSSRPASTIPRKSTDSISLVTLSRPQLSRSMAFLQLQEQVDQATITVSSECLGVQWENMDLGGGMLMDRAPPEKHITIRQRVDYKPVMHKSTGARPKVVTREVPLRESLEFGRPQSRAMAALPMAEGEVVELRRSSRFKLSFADDLVNEEPEEPTESSVDEEPEEPPILPAATSSGHDDLGLPRGEPDPYFLHVQNESLKKIKREWQEAREALLEERLEQWICFQEELEREKEALYLRLQQDREKQERELCLFAEQSRHDLSWEKLTLKALRDKGRLMRRCNEQNSNGSCGIVRKSLGNVSGGR
uniref:Uncharacterized protein n=1 Tax=Sphaerodactylus townsendi TaxID=933632 RepID=A0ACB8F1V0_9SAUR